MREWQKPTIDETESGMEVTSYLPAEIDLQVEVANVGSRTDDGWKGLSCLTSIARK